MKITGRDVANRSLTGKDIKKRSVPLNRLRGSLPNLRRAGVFGDWVSPSGNGTTLMLDPALPATIADKAMRLRAVTPCWDATASAMINGLVISTFRENAAGAATDIVEHEDPDDRSEAICKRYEFAPPVDMAGGRRVSIRINVGPTTAGDTIHIGGATFEFDRAP